MKIGITEKGDGGLDQSWRSKISMIDGAIIITKAPQLLIMNTKLPKNIIVHCTITGWGGTTIEPGVASPKITLNAWNALKDRLGKERVVLRVDPIITERPELAIKVAKCADEDDRIRVSFMDLYPHVKARFEKSCFALKQQSFHANLQERMKILKMLPPQTEVCGEPELKCTGCISQRDLDAMDIKGQSIGKCTQRQSCACMAEKTELLTDRKQCKHGCLYCYWK